MIPELDLARVQRWLGERNACLPARARGQLEYQLDVSDRAITVLECRPPWNAALMGQEGVRRPVARFRYNASRCQWSLYCHRNLKFQMYDDVEPSTHITALLAAIDTDHAGLFFG